MGNKELKKIMTDLAAGHITEKEAEDLMEEQKVAQIKPKGKKKTTRKRKNVLKKRGVLE